MRYVEESRSAVKYAAQARNFTGSLARIGKLRHPSAVLIHNVPDATHLLHQDVASPATQPAEMVDVQDRFGFIEIESGLRNGNVSQVVREPLLKIARLALLQLPAPHNDRIHSSWQVQFRPNI
jgi:hypothetical protein